MKTKWAEALQTSLNPVFHLTIRAYVESKEAYLTYILLIENDPV